MNQRLGPAGFTRIEAIQDPVPDNFLHCAIFLGGGRMLDSGDFRLVRFEGQETSSDLFEYQLELHGNSSSHHGDRLEFEDLIGRPLTVGINYPAPAAPGTPRGSVPDATEMTRRFARALGGDESELGIVLFNGMISAFALEAPGVYRIIMKPALHRLTLSNNYRLHAQTNVRDLIAKLLDEARVSYSMAALSHAANPAVARVQDWLQAGESNLDFLRRLMGKAQLYFFFVHSGNSHKIIFANRPAYPNVFASDHAMRYTHTDALALGLTQSDVIFQYSYQRQLSSSSVRGVFTRQHACWEGDAILGPDSFTANSSALAGEMPFNLYKIYQYGCSKDEVTLHTSRTAAAMQAAAHVFSGSSYCARFRVGHQFFVQGTYVDGAEPGPLRPALDLQRFVLTSVKHQASADGDYQNQFQAAPAAGLISGYSMQETQQGSVLGQVVAKSGGRAEDWRYYQAAYVDPEHSSVSDPGVGPRLQTVGVYVRLSTAAPDAAPVWVKLAPHMQTAPEPGVTVLIARAQDESELPEIQSIIHNNGTTNVMPSGWSANSHVGSNYSTSYGDGRSVRFGQFSVADLGAAVARLDAAYGEGKRYREVSFSQGASYSFSCSELLAGAASDLRDLQGKYPDATDVLSASESFGSTYSRHHAQVVSSASTIGTSYAVSTTGRSDTVSLVTGLSTSEATHQGDVEARTTMRAASRNWSDHYGDVASTTTHHGGASVASTTTVEGDSSNVSVIHGTNSSRSDHNVSTSVSSTNRQSNASTVLLNETNDTNVLNKRMSMTGVSGEVSATAMHNSVSVTGQSNTVQIVGDSNSIELSGPGASVKQKGEQVGADTIDLNVTIIVAMQIFL